MKQQTRVALVAAVLVAVPALSMAAGGKITFNGKVIKQTCMVDVKGTTSPEVKLEAVSTTQLAVAGDSAGITPFTVRISNCTEQSAAVNVNTVFSGAPIELNGTKGVLQNTASSGAATNVALELLRDTTGNSNSVIDLTSVTSVDGLVVPPGATEATKEFAVRYVALGAATAGNVQAVVNYDITYQ